MLGEPHGSLFCHDWYIGTDDEVDERQLQELIDAKLIEVNDDYKVERSHALRELNIKVLPTSVFYDWMESQGKIGGQNKFPRVLKKEKATHWKDFLVNQNLLLSIFQQG